jgi:hypothetical protein
MEAQKKIGFLSTHTNIEFHARRQTRKLGTTISNDARARETPGITNVSFAVQD